MRIVIDMQGAQSESRYRGIGRYSLSLAKAIVRNRGAHEIFLALSSLFPETIEAIRDEFHSLLPQDNIRLWHGVGPTLEAVSSNTPRRQVSEYLREAAIAAMQPDVVLITSLFEGLGDDSVTSVARFDDGTPTVAILYDLIPLIAPDEHFRSNPIHIAYYQRKIDSLKRCTALLAISGSAKNEALEALSYSDDLVTNISSGCDPRFRPMPLDVNEREVLFNKFCIKKPFVMYTGGADERKNLDRLIQAFADLPKNTRANHQLVLVGKMPTGNVECYKASALRAGLSADELLFTGYVSDDELMQLYTACRLFVFPSLHEGFGLPPLEAMACGAPVVASNATSLPEVVGREDALFDPYSVLAITEKMQRVLTDDSFRSDLIRFGMDRVKSFSWDESARRAIAVLDTVAKPSILSTANDRVKETNTGIFKPKALHILVSKLDHMGDLVLAIPALFRLKARYPDAKIDALVGSWNLDQAKSLKIFENIHVLDFFSKKSADASRVPAALDSLLKGLPHYNIAIDLRRQPDTRFILPKLSASIRVGYSTGDTTIDSQLTICLPSEDDVAFETTAMNRSPIALQMLRLVDCLPTDSNDYIKSPALIGVDVGDKAGVAIFPNAGNAIKEWGHERYRSLIKILVSDTSIPRVGIFVGTAKESEYFSDLSSNKVSIYCGLDYYRLRNELASYKVCVANNSFGVHLSSVLGLSVVGIYGGQETVNEWGPVFGDCRVLSFPVTCSPCHLPDRALCKHELRCLSEISPERVYVSVMEAIGGVKRLSIDTLRAQLLNSISPLVSNQSEEELFQLATAISQNFPEQSRKRLFVDISELVTRDARTGIQRVVRSILKNLLENDELPYEVLPVYATESHRGYRLANGFLSLLKRLGENDAIEDTPIDYRMGDVFLGLDLQPVIVPTQREYFRLLRNEGVSVYFVVYDMLCMRLRQHFEHGVYEAFENWLSIVADSDGAICISRSVAEDVDSWLRENNAPRKKGFEIRWFHIGADIDASMPSRGKPENSSFILGEIKRHTSFLMVGTLEPRKGHGQVLEAFEELWADNQDFVLVIVGKRGWLAEELVERIRTHSENGRRLIWLEAISDEYLDEVYASVDCLIAASIGEGFGLPLIEAAQHGLPIIARDLKVFHEVAGAHAFYFKGESTKELSREIRDWFELFQKGDHPSSKSMPFLTWKQSTQQLLTCLDSMSESRVQEHREVVQ